MDDFEKWIENERRLDEIKRQKFLKLVSDTVGHDGRLVFNLLTLKVAQRYELEMFDLMDIDYTPCWKIAKHYVDSDDIDLGFEEWLYSEDAPLLMRLSSIGKVFPELKEIAKNDRHIVKLANELYGLELKVDDCGYTRFVYAYRFNFNSFTPLDLKRVKELKVEIGFCKKYGLDCTSLEDQVKECGLTMEMLEVI